MDKRVYFLSRANEAAHPLFRETVYPKEDLSALRMKEGDRLDLDFGDHFVGFVTLELGYEGDHPDAPLWLGLRFAERSRELEERVEDYRGSLSRSWIQQTQLHIDVLPARIRLPRRYAFRYLRLEVLGMSHRFRLTVKEVSCEAVTAADERCLKPYRGPADHARLDKIACRTLRECMQDVFEDGPKRDRRLWLGDLRMQALANFETYGDMALVRRCLYLFAAAANEEGKIPGCLYTEPKVEADGTMMFDYSLLFLPTLLDYYRASGDRQTFEDLAPEGLRQITFLEPAFREDLARYEEELGCWCFLDWKEGLDKQAGAQGVYLYSLKAAIEAAELLGRADWAEALREDYRRKRMAAERLFDPALGLYVSGPQRQVSWASQIWMVLGGAEHGDGALLDRVAACPEALGMITPYMRHIYLDALMAVGRREQALEELVRYWGGMADAGADTFWELWDPADPDASPYGGTAVNSYCHAWSCAPAYFLRKFF